MIREVVGDILLSKAGAIAHGVAPNDDFKNGLALSLREHWPSLYKDFRHYCQTYSPKSGGIWAWVSPTGLRIINLLTQEAAPSHGVHPGPAQLDYVNHSLRDLAAFLKEEKVSSVALPRLATGVGRLSWDEVSPLIHKHLGGLGIPVYIYSTYQKGVAAAES